jgi:hypothetical protein
LIFEPQILQIFPMKKTNEKNLTAIAFCKHIGFAFSPERPARPA